MFESLASCFAFHCSSSLNATAIDEALQRTLFASDVRLWLGVGDFYLGYFAVGLAGGFQFSSFDRIGLGAEKKDPGDFAVNVEVVPARLRFFSFTTVADSQLSAS